MLVLFLFQACVLVQYGPLVHRSLGSNSDSVFAVYKLSDDEQNEWEDWQADRLYLRYHAESTDDDGKAMYEVIYFTSTISIR